MNTAVQVTLAAADTNYELLALVRALEPGYIDNGEVTIQADPLNAVDVLVGDSSLSAVRFGLALASGQGRSYSRGGLYGRYVRASAAAQKLNIEISR
jgi:hypothetical protein